MQKPQEICLKDFLLSKIDFDKYNDTLFLDRDGVINLLRPNDYVKAWSEFEFNADFLDAIPLLSKKFKRILLVTNQRGVGKGLMTEADLLEIHTKMIAEIKKIGGRIDKIYCCTAIDENDKQRKPNIGMALQAKLDFPDMDFSRSLMLGDSDSDMKFAQNAGIFGIKLTPKCSN